jgi:hypothetical protein
VLRTLALLAITLAVLTAVLASAATLRVDAGVLQVFKYKAEIEIPDLRANVDIKPDALEKKSSGEPVVAYIDLPGSYDEHDVDVSSVMLCRGTAKCVTGVPVGNVPPPDVVGGRLKVGFNRGDLVGLLSGVHPPARVDFTVSGRLHSHIGFYGSDSVRLVDPDSESTTPIATPTTMVSPAPHDTPEPTVVATPTPETTSTPQPTMDVSPTPPITPEPTATQGATPTADPTPNYNPKPTRTPRPTSTPKH